MPDPAQLGEAMGRFTVRAIGYALLAFPMAAVGTWIYHIPNWRSYAIMLVALAIWDVTKRFGSVRVSTLRSRLKPGARR